MLCETSSEDLVAEGKRREHKLLLSWFPPSAKYRETVWTNTQYSASLSVAEYNIVIYVTTILLNIFMCYPNTGGTLGSCSSLFYG